jgi:5-azacytidine-induced protein 1
VVDKTKEIKEATVRGLEPDIERLVARHREELWRLEQELRAEMGRQLASENSLAEREAARARAAAEEDTRQAVGRERARGEARLAEAAAKREEEERALRQRLEASAAADRAEEQARARREMSRLEDELRKAREEAAATEAQVESRASSGGAWSWRAHFLGMATSVHALCASLT